MDRAAPRNPIIVIPARLAATRLPGKPLAEIAGVPMIVQVWRRAVAADAGPVVVACGDREIADAVEAVGGRAVLTDPQLPTGSDRVHQAVSRLDPGRAHDAVINVQGDLPMLDPSAVRLALAGLADPDTDIATLAAIIEDAAALADDQRQQGRRRVCRSGPAGARALFQQGGDPVGGRTPLRAYRALRLSPRRARRVLSGCRAAFSNSASASSSCARSKPACGSRSA